MIIQGMQKLTLLDYPQKVACIIFCGGCNFRCPFCHNASLVIDKQGVGSISEDEVLEFLKKRQGLLDGVVITGGEPLLQPDLEQFIRKIKDLGYLVKLDTNGYQPEKLADLIRCEILDYIAMDIKNSKEKYSLTAGVNIDITKIEESVRIIMNSNVDYEFRTTVVQELHSEDDFTTISSWISGAKNYYLQRFTDGPNLIKQGCFTPPTNESLMKYKGILEPFVENIQIRGI